MKANGGDKSNHQSYGAANLPVPLRCFAKYKFRSAIGCALHLLTYNADENIGLIQSICNNGLKLSSRTNGVFVYEFR